MAACFIHCSLSGGGGGGGFQRQGNTEHTHSLPPLTSPHHLPSPHPIPPLLSPSSTTPQHSASLPCVSVGWVLLYTSTIHARLLCDGYFSFFGGRGLGGGRWCWRLQNTSTFFCFYLLHKSHRQFAWVGSRLNDASEARGWICKASSGVVKPENSLIFSLPLHADDDKGEVNEILFTQAESNTLNSE